MINKEQVQGLMDMNVEGSDGFKIGTVGQIFLDDKTGQAEWATVSTGTFSNKQSFVPLADAQVSGDALTVPFDQAKVKDAPQVDVEAGHLSPDEEAELYRYYGLGYTDTSDDTTNSGTVGYYTSGPTTDDAMTRSEERLTVNTQQRESGHARLRKYVDTETVTQTVPVTREKAYVEHEPITDANRAKSMDGPEITEAEHEVILHEERVVASKETVPVERVRMGTQTVTGEEQVTEEVRKEQIEADGVDPSSTR